MGFAQTHEGIIPSTSLSNSPFPLNSLRGTSFAKKQAGERQTMNVCHSPARRLSVLSFRQGQLLRYHSLRSFLMLASSLDFIRSLSLEVVTFPFPSSVRARRAHLSVSRNLGRYVARLLGQNVAGSLGWNAAGHLPGDVVVVEGRFPLIITHYALGEPPSSVRSLGGIPPGEAAPHSL